MEFFKLAQAWGFSLPDLLLVVILIKQYKGVELLRVMLHDHATRLAVMESKV